MNRERLIWEMFSGASAFEGKFYAPTPSTKTLGVGTQRK